jgi:hypothetical protein
MCALFVNVVFTSDLEGIGAPPPSGFYCSTKLHFVYPEYGDMNFLQTVDTCCPIYMTCTLKDGGNECLRNTPNESTVYTGSHYRELKFFDLRFVYTGPVAYPGIFFRGGSTNSAEDRENRNLGVVAP